MRKNFKHILVFISILSSNMAVFCQIQPYYKDVLLNGKPAKLNVATGEFIMLDTTTTLYNYVKPKKEKAALVVSQKEEVVPDYNYHIVKKGETLLDISKQYNVLLGTLKKYNNLETTLVAPGQRIRLSAPEKNEENTNIWIVSKGETLYSIATKNNMRVKQLKALNGIKANTIVVGQKLRLK